MTDSDRKRLRELAEVATQLQWRHGSVEKYHVFVECTDPECLGTERVLLKMNTYFPYEADCAFIAAANPQTVLALLDEIERLERRWKQHVGPIEADRECLREDLAAVTAARDKLASIADDLNGDNGDDEELHRRRAEIAELRKVGQ